MSDEPISFKEFLDAIIAKVSVVAKNPELFTKDGGWNDATRGLDKLIEKLNDESDTSARQNLIDKRDDGVCELIILMRMQLARSYLFDDLQLQVSQGCTILSDYADLKPRPSDFGGHKCDGIEWTEAKLSMMPDHPKRRFDFRGGAGGNWEYRSCLDHVITNLICKVWGHSDIGEAWGSKNFRADWWKDASMYFAVLLCFGDNVLDDHVFLDKIGVTFNEPVTSQDRLQTVLSAKEAKDIREALWERIQELILNGR